MIYIQGMINKFNKFSDDIGGDPYGMYYYTSNSIENVSIEDKKTASNLLDDIKIQMNAKKYNL